MTTFVKEPCPYCDGEGYVEDIEDYTEDWLECFNCEGTGDRFGRGHTLPNPMEWNAG